MDDLVLIPTFDRPEMLWLCLEYLSRSPDIDSVQVRVYVDAHMGQTTPHADIEKVLLKFPQLKLYEKLRNPHMFHGNSYNVMLAYRDAYEETSAKHVFLVEDDIVVQPEFFAWHRQQHENRHVECSVGVSKRPEHAHYASLGVCFRREILGRIVPHCHPSYFKDMRGYCRHMFPLSKIDCEQDGLWCRLLAPQAVMWPKRKPVAQHVGWYGYHRKKSIRPQGTLEERFDQVRQVLTNESILRVWQKEFGDVMVVDIP